jgi:hypothetical protein
VNKNKKQNTKNILNTLMYVIALQYSKVEFILHSS